ncbi:hypothetical protein [Rhodomicrobium vannielii]|nr:hypothetical protein [Rhodomicrobium vannielii]
MRAVVANRERAGRPAKETAAYGWPLCESPSPPSAEVPRTPIGEAMDHHV